MNDGPQRPEIPTCKRRTWDRGRRGVLSSSQPIVHDLYDAGRRPVSLSLKDLKIRFASLPFSEHLSLLVRDWRRRVLRFEDHGLKDGPIRSVSKGFSRFYENRVKCRSSERMNCHIWQPKVCCKNQSSFPSSGNTEAVSFMRAISPPYLRADSGIVVTNSNDDVGLLVVTFAGRGGRSWGSQLTQKRAPTEQNRREPRQLF